MGIVMSLRRLLEAFGTRTQLPVEVEEVRDALLNLGIQDRIHITSVDQPIEEMRGSFYQWIERDGVYGSPILCTSITFSTRQDLPWRRVVCCKELMHLLDHPGAHTHTRDEVASLAERLLGPSSTDEVSPSDFMASTDKIALYYAIAILFPKAARDEAVEAVRNGQITVEELANASQLPVSMVHTVLSEDWPGILDILLDC